MCNNTVEFRKYFLLKDIPLHLRIYMTGLEVEL